MTMEYSSSSFLFRLALTSLLFLLSLLLITLLSGRTTNHRLPPSPRALPVVGHLHLIRAPVHRAFHRLTSRYGPLIHLRLGSTPCVIAASPDVAREFLKSNDATFSNRPLSVATRVFAYDAAGFAFAPYGPYWRFVKRLCVSDLLAPRTVDFLRPVRRAELHALVYAVLTKAKLREAVDLTWELIRMSNDEIVKMTTGTTVAMAEEVRMMVKDVAELVGSFNLEDFVGLCKGWDLQGLGRRINEVHKRFDGFLERIIKVKEKKRRRKREGIEVVEEEVKVLLDILLDVAEDENAEFKLSRENIKGFILDIITAGSDSTAASIEWALAELINRPEIRRKLQQELDQVVGKRRLVDETDLPNLPYLQAVFKETMRLHPPAPILQRQSTKHIEVNGYDIPQGTILFVNIWSIGRDPNYWEDPLEFRPERFLDSDVDMKGLHFQCIPFGSGRRGCPGMGLALQAGPTTVGVLMQCFEWEVGGDGKVDMEDGVGLINAKVKPLVIVPVPRLDPFPDI
ncbi:cytochrome P450 93G1-like [Typha latifolia]|uniref:cytochrome P450 93G1-like n=1 Tax=Typha latifolia TaxID=4733 RepID=UPI003C2DA228